MSLFTLLGFVVLALGFLALRFIALGFKEGRLGRMWLLALAAVLVVGSFLGIAAATHSRYPTPDTRLLGFPFLAAVFERSPNGGWADFVGLLTLPATLGNFGIGLFLPCIVFATVAWVITRSRNEA